MIVFVFCCRPIERSRFYEISSIYIHFVSCVIGINEEEDRENEIENPRMNFHLVLRRTSCVVLLRFVLLLLLLLLLCLEFGYDVFPVLCLP